MFDRWRHLLLILFPLINPLLFFCNYEAGLISCKIFYNIKLQYEECRAIFLFPLYLFPLEARNLFEEQFILFAERIWTRNKMGVFMWKGICVLERDPEEIS